jgi:thiosulfate dehydrogenase [quinone] large subunit
MSRHAALPSYTPWQAISLVILRIVIGWHFLFEGAVKLFDSSWSSKSFLLDSAGIMPGFFKSLANHPGTLAVVDILNEWGLVLIGMAFILGIFNRISAPAGILLLLLYYLSHPALTGIQYQFPSEGSYFLVNKNIVEMFAIFVLMFFPTGHIFGLERVMRRKR